MAVAKRQRPGRATTKESRNVFARVSIDLHRRVRLRAAEEDRSIAEVVTSALKLYLSRPAGSAPKMGKKN